MADAKTTTVGAAAIAVALGSAFTIGKMGATPHVVTDSPIAVSADPISDPEVVKRIVGVHVQLPCEHCKGAGGVPSPHPPSAARGIMAPCPVCRGHGSTLETVAPATLKAMLGVP